MGKKRIFLRVQIFAINISTVEILDLIKKWRNERSGGTENQVTKQNNIEGNKKIKAWNRKVINKHWSAV